jgi:hypothetical protein
MPHMTLHITPHAVDWKRWRIGMSRALVSPLLLLLAGCATGGAARTITTSAAGVASQPTPKVTYAAPGTLYPLADVHFQASIDYLTALRFVTNLGLQPLYACTGYDGSYVRWRPQDERDGFAATAMPPHTLEVAATPLAPSDWLQRCLQVQALRRSMMDRSSAPISRWTSLIFLVASTFWARAYGSSMCR